MFLRRGDLLLQEEKEHSLPKKWLKNCNSCMLPLTLMTLPLLPEVIIAFLGILPHGYRSQCGDQLLITTRKIEYGFRHKLIIIF